MGRLVAPNPRALRGLIPTVSAAPPASMLLFAQADAGLRRRPHSPPARPRRRGDDRRLPGALLDRPGRRQSRGAGTYGPPPGDPGGLRSGWRREPPRVGHAARARAGP